MAETEEALRESQRESQRDRLRAEEQMAEMKEMKELSAWLSAQLRALSGADERCVELSAELKGAHNSLQATKEAAAAEAAAQAERVAAAEERAELAERELETKKASANVSEYMKNGTWCRDISEQYVRDENIKKCSARQIFDALTDKGRKFLGNFPGGTSWPERDLCLGWAMGTAMSKVRTTRSRPYQGLT